MSRRILIVGRARAPELAAAVSRAKAEGEVVLLTDERAALPAMPGGVTVLEPEELLPQGVAEIEPAWDEGVGHWLDRIYPGQLLGRAVGRVLWVNVFCQPLWWNRISEVATVERLFARFPPDEVHLVGHTFFNTVTIEEEAHARGLQVFRDDRPMQRRSIPVGRLVLVWIGLVLSSILRNLRLLPRRRRTQRALEQAVPVRNAAPEVWFGMSPAWRQPSVKFMRAVIAPWEEAGRSFGIVYVGSFGLGRSSGDRDMDELALLDGSVAALHPVAVAQAAGATSVRDLIKAVTTWLPLSFRSLAAILKHGRSLRIAGCVGACPEDLVECVRVGTTDLFRVVEAAQAAERWFSKGAAPRVVAFNLAPTAEAKIVDELLQARGTITVDCPHGYTGEQNVRMVFRSSSRVNVSWTEDQAARFRAMGVHEEVVGGYAPWQPRPRLSRGDRPRILVAPNYVKYPVYPQNEKYAVQFIGVLREALTRLADRIEVRVRLHPLDDPKEWLSHFAAPERPSLSTSQWLGEDLAWADLFVTTFSSTVIEGLLYDMPVFIHRGPPVERDSIYARFPPERWFTTGNDLSERIESALAGRCDLAVERNLRSFCFGPTGAPRPIEPLLARLASRGVESRAEGSYS